MMQPNRFQAAFVRMRANRQHIFFLVVGIVALALLLVLGRSPHETAAQSPDTKAGANTPAVAARSIVPTLAGTASCSARGCHGLLDGVAEANKCRQDEYVKWTRDPHADAFRVLFDKRSVRIAKLLNGESGLKAHEDPRCLACHSTPQSVNLPKDNLIAQSERPFGVGCEACHGSAGSWLAAHTVPQPGKWDLETKRKRWTEIGMVDVMTNLNTRAEVCAGCHVGAPATKELYVRDVNHELIAAGHPRLQFEFGSFQANMPSHWREKKHAATNLWAIGQLATSQACLELLANRVDDEKRWPELAEYDCFACHHTLSGSSWRQQNSPPRGRKPGNLAWGTWSFAFTRELGAGVKADATLEGALNLLEKAMQNPYPNRALVKEKVGQALAQLKVVRAELGRKPDEAKTRQLIRSIVHKDRSKDYLSWDDSEQLYLALHALNESERDPATTAVLNKLAPLRAWPAGFDSPLGLPGHGTPAFSPKDFLNALKPPTK